MNISSPEGIKEKMRVKGNLVNAIMGSGVVPAASVPTSNLVCIKEVAIRTTFCIVGIIYYSCSLAVDIQCTRYKMHLTNVFNELYIKITMIYSDKNLTVCNAVYLRLCIDLIHILPPVTAERYDGSHHPRYAEWACLSLNF